jgi:hypothetical protein
MKPTPNTITNIIGFAILASEFLASAGILGPREAGIAQGAVGFLTALGMYFTNK